MNCFLSQLNIQHAETWRIVLWVSAHPPLELSTVFEASERATGIVISRNLATSARVFEQHFNNHVANPKTINHTLMTYHLGCGCKTIIETVPFRICFFVQRRAN